MRRFNKQGILVFVCAIISILILCGAVSVTNSKQNGEESSSRSVSSQNIRLLPNGSTGFYLLRTDDKNTKINCLNNCGTVFNDNDEEMLPTTLDYLYSLAGVQGQQLYLVSSSKWNSSFLTYGVTFSHSLIGQKQSSVFDSYFFPDIKTINQQNFTVDQNGNIYYLSGTPKKILTIYSNRYQNTSVIYSGYANFSSVCVSPDNYLYITYCSGGKIGVQKMTNGVPINEPCLFDSDIPAIPYRFLSNTTVIDANETIFRVQGAPPVFHKIKKITGNSRVACALNNGDIVCKTGPRTAERFTCDGTLISKYKFNGELLDLASNGIVSAAFELIDKTLNFVDLSQAATAPVSKTPSSNSSQTTSTPTQSSSGSGSSQTTTKIQSIRYPIDRNNGLLYMDTSVTLAQAKNNIPCKGATLRFIKPNGNIIESGSLGTQQLYNYYLVVKQLTA